MEIRVLRYFLTVVREVVSRVMRKIDFGLWEKSITWGGGLTAPLGYYSVSRAQRVKGGDTPLVLPLTLCDLVAITWLSALAP